MTVQDSPIHPDPQEKPARSPEVVDKNLRKERSAELERERVRREAEDEITAVFSLHDQLRQSTQAVVQALETSIGHAALLDRKCATGRLGRRLYLARRLSLKALLTVLGVARTQLKKSVGRMEADARLRDSLVEEATDPELDH